MLALCADRRLARMDSCNPNCTQSSATISYASKSIVARTLSATGKAPPRLPLCLAQISTQTWPNCPDLAKLQCEQGALHSYREAESNLEKLNAQRRSVNNHARVKSLTNQLGAQLAKEHEKPPTQEELPAPAAKLVVQVDGGHIPTGTTSSTTTSGKKPIRH